ncbi:hypothetical protein APHAL10511_003632 [Amanita phalloides]|nr:hypothetical protein APHAL10511_003632 [Amanita phalloides]
MASNVPFFKKGKSRPSTARKRSPEPSTSSALSSNSQVVLPSKKLASNLLSAGTKRSLSHRDEHGDIDSPDVDGPDIKWSAEGSHLNTALEILAGDEVEELIAKRRRKEQDLAGDPDGETPDDGLYHGKNAYKSHIKKSTEIPKSMRVGPQRSTNTIRTVTIIDYQPDVCKDYKETGFCGFGDTCKFLHDRGTYLSGWQLDKLAENPQKQVEDVSDSDSDEDVPFACLICRKHYTEPVVTRCGHYYCSACAIKRFSKTPKCLACGAPTGGIFNRADKIIEKINKKKQKLEGRDTSDDGQNPQVEIEGLNANTGHDSDSSDRSGD